ncbi:predicted protein [Arabidopsis lyrata subsp. lyrata]|uniref:Predicted protein n=1 Tax=Arabidopsis lyrata subsp. lyrata TaxID=81972 RepID=D7MJG4_ARALL|nr:predicted protein [Arabidopsis lyrata subsp. lyrata]
MLRESRDATRVPRRCERASSAMLRESQLGDAARVPRCCKSAAMLQECRDAARVSRRCVRASSAMLRESQLGDAAREPAQRRCNSAAMLRECRDATREPARRCCESASSAMLQESQIGDAAREPARRCCERASSAMLQESQLSDAARVPRSCERASSAMLRESQLGDAAREPARRCCKRKLRRCESATTLRESQLGDTAREPARRCCVRVTILRECTVRRVRFDLVSTRCFFGDAAAWPWEIVAWFSGGKRGSARWICSGSAVSCLGRVVSLVRFVKNLRLVEEGVVVQLLVVQRPRGEPWFGECELAGQRRGISGSSWRGISGRPIITNCITNGNVFPILRIDSTGVLNRSTQIPTSEELKRIGYLLPYLDVLIDLLNVLIHIEVMEELEGRTRGRHIIDQVKRCIQISLLLSCVFIQERAEDRPPGYLVRRSHLETGSSS